MKRFKKDIKLLVDDLSLSRIVSLRNRISKTVSTAYDPVMAKDIVTILDRLAQVKERVDREEK